MSCTKRDLVIHRLSTSHSYTRYDRQGPYDELVPVMLVHYPGTLYCLNMVSNPPT